MHTAFDDRAWFDHLTGADREVIARFAAEAGVDPGDAGSDPRALSQVLSHPAPFAFLFGNPDAEPFLAVSSFLAFALVVHRTWAELRAVGHVDEWVGPRRRLPILGGQDLREFLAVAAHRLFLTELLASYTHVASGSTWVRTRRGWRRRRFSELDPVRLATLLDVVPEAERPGIYRRLGDLALFLTGVFPDHTELHGLGAADEDRLLRLTGLAERPEPPAGTGFSGAVGLLELLGERWYRLAARTASPRTAAMDVVAQIGERFSLARRTLNHLTDRHLYPRRGTWFGAPPS